MSVTAGDTFGADNWGDALRRYKTQKTNSQFRPEDTKVHHVTRYEMSRKEREFDPVLQYWRDNKREQNTRNMETTNLRQTLNRARDKQMRYTQTFDIITHVPKVEEPPAKPRAPPAPSTRTQFNIISNLDFAHHHYTKPSERPPPAPASSRKPPGVTVKGRDYNIISNKYVVKHEDKDAVDKEVARQEASEKFWQTRDFNLLTCSFYDKAKEDKFTAERTEELSKHADVDKQLTKLPPSAKLSEGVCYDIVTMKTRHPGQMAKRVQLDQKSLNSKIGNEVEQRIRDRGDTLRDRAEARSLARMSDTRFKDTYRHGYNILTNQRFDGVGALPVRSHSATTKQTTWTKMVDEANNRRWAQVSQHSPSRQASQASQGRSNNQTNHAAAAAALPRSASSNGVRRESAARPSSGADVAVIHGNGGAAGSARRRPSSVPVSHAASQRSGRGDGGSVRSRGFAWSQNMSGRGNGGGAGAGAGAGAGGGAPKGPSARSKSTPPVPRLPMGNAPSGSARASRAASQSSLGGGGGGGSVRTGGFR